MRTLTRNELNRQREKFEHLQWCLSVRKSLLNEVDLRTEIYRLNLRDNHKMLIKR